MKKPKASLKLKFQSTLKSISDQLEYYAVPVPEKITKALGTRAAVPVLAQVNNSTPFFGSFYTAGGGRHAMRVKASVRKEVNIKEGDRVRVKITVRDRFTEVSIPHDVVKALKVECVFEDFNSIPLGERSFLLRKIDEAARPETREKRIQTAIEAAYRRKEKNT